MEARRGAGRGGGPLRIWLFVRVLFAVLLLGALVVGCDMPQEPVHYPDDIARTSGAERG